MKPNKKRIQGRENKVMTRYEKKKKKKKTNIKQYMLDASIIRQ
jgi:hypothetical protein